jgi:cation-transporting P-type ATPase E
VTSSADYLARGLTASEVAACVARGQVNRPPAAGWGDYRDIAVRNLATLYNLLIVPAALALFLLDEYRSAWAVSALAAANTVIGFVQELRAKRHLDRLAILAETHVRVRRDGMDLTLPAGAVVQGDCVLLVPGEALVADGSVVAARFLEIDEALLTGESDPVPRGVGDRLLSGSYCVAGDGAYRVEQVGAASFANQTSLRARRYRFVSSPMQQILNTLIRILTGITILLCLVYVGLFFARGLPRTELWQMIAATVTSMIPQGLVLMTTLAFTLGALRLSARGAVVQRLSAVEAMASLDVLCMDKTGTLTTGRLSLCQLHTFDDEEDVREKLRLFAWTSMDVGNKAIQALRTALGELPAARPPEALEQVPFKAQNRYSAVRVRADDGEMALVLGAFEALQPLLAETTAAHAAAVWQELLATGGRLLLFAAARLPGGAPPMAGSLQGLTLRPLALVGLSDELRPDAGAVLKALATQGIRFKILSGDNPETVRATLASLHLPFGAQPVVSGPQLDSAAKRADFISAHSVFGRVVPRQKLEIISVLQGQGHRVGMIGDGVNDVLAIKSADLGIAMGAGASAAKTVAGLVLENNAFALLPAALEEGRTLLHNLRRAAKLFLLKNVYTLFLIVVAVGILGHEFPYLPQQVTLLNALTIGGPAVLLMLNKQTGAPRVADVQTEFLHEVGWFALGAGLAMGLAALLVVPLAAAGAGADPAARRTLLLSTLILAGLGNVLLVAGRDARLVTWSACALPVYVALMYWPPTADFFELAPLAGAQWRAVATAALFALALSILTSRLCRAPGGGSSDESR